MSGGIWAFVLILLIVAVVRVRAQRRRGGISTGAAGVVYDMLNEDQRHAVEIIVEERAAARDPEDRDGNLPDLVGPKR